MRDEHGFIQTYSGKKFWPLEPNEEALCIEDIAHALSNNCRWTGHCRDFYSVAQHSLIMSENVPTGMELTALMHDASEAYLSDLSRPVKHSAEMEAYRKAERRLEQSIAHKFGLLFDDTKQPWPYPQEVKTADNRMLYTERRDILAGPTVTWTTDKQNVLGVEGDLERTAYDFVIVPLAPREAEKRFLERFHELNGKYAAA
jgi:5'-deoxynucleotidase YfbR-like HD superfamily hydrolase